MSASLNDHVATIYRALQAAERRHPNSPAIAALHEALRLGAVELRGTVAPGLVIPLDGTPKK